MRLLSLLLLLSVTTSCFDEKKPGIYCDKQEDCTNPAYPVCYVEYHACYNPDMGSIKIPCTPETAAQRCKDKEPVCGDDKFCRACSTHSECSSQVCKADGSCAAEAEVAYVDNKNGSCSTEGTGENISPFCEIQTAVTMGKRLIRVVGSTTAYKRVELVTGAFSIIGPDSGATAKIAGDIGKPTVLIRDTVSSAELTSLEVQGGGVNQEGILCSGIAEPLPALNLSRVTITGVSGTGLSATKCVVTTDRSKIGPGNSAGGISLNNAKFQIVNTFIVGNNAVAPGINFSGDSTPTGNGFIHNTIVNNGAPGTIGGIRCAANTAISIANSIIWNNSKMANSQFSGTCVFTNTSIDENATPSGSGNRNTPTPDFLSNTDFHLNGKTTNNLACCVDQIDSSLIDHDYDGTKRPQGPKWDIGAHEVK